MWWYFCFFVQILMTFCKLVRSGFALFAYVPQKGHKAYYVLILEANIRTGSYVFSITPLILSSVYNARLSPNSVVN